jgi:NitT/TauT family transport system ATP-binding protein
MIYIKGLNWETKKGDKIEKIFENFCIEIETHENVVLLGPSGCGKTTLLKNLFGLYKNKNCTELNDNFEKEKSSFLFQDSLLIPWKNVEENIIMPIIIKKGRKNKDIDLKNIQKILGEIMLSGYENKFPIELSGGEARRVAFARAMINEPDYIFLDEPFSGLDYVTKKILIDYFIKLDEQYRDMTVIMTTHDIEDALLVGDRIIILGGTPSKMVKQIMIYKKKPRDIHSMLDYAEEIKDILIKEYFITYQG